MTSTKTPARVVRRHRRAVRLVPWLCLASLLVAAVNLGSGHPGVALWPVLLSVVPGALGLGLWLARPPRRCPCCGRSDRGVHLTLAWPDGHRVRHLCPSCAARYL